MYVCRGKSTTVHVPRSTHSYSCSSHLHITIGARLSRLAAASDHMQHAFCTQRSAVKHVLISSDYRPKVATVNVSASTVWTAWTKATRGYALNLPSFTRQFTCFHQKGIFAEGGVVQLRY